MTPHRPSRARAIFLALALLCPPLIAWGAEAPFHPQAIPGAPNGWAKSRVILLPRAGLAEVELARILAPHSGISRALGNSGLRLVELPPGADERAIAERLTRHPDLEFAEIDRRMPVAMAPNDPYFGAQWHLERIGAPSAWDLTQGAGVIIAIIDTGVDASHPDLSARITPGWNFHDSTADTRDAYNHGTATAGAAAASANNGIGVAGVSGGSKIMPIRVTDASGYAFASAVASGIAYATEHGARVASISLSGVAASAATLSAARYMKSRGGLVVVAAGNAGIDEGIPATNALIPVSATDTADQLTSWSSFGGHVALSAPGLNIWTPSRGGGYGSHWGTSFSAPITAGVIALMMSVNPALPNTQIESLLLSTAKDLGAPGRDIQFGFGRINAGAAVAAAASALPKETQPPTNSP